ncbi:MAG TPA: FAD-dependent oxidoreductase, partial [Acidimicrobiales bacterium]
IHDTDGTPFTVHRAAELQAARDRRMGRAARIALSAQGGGSFGQALDSAAPDWAEDPELAWSIDDVLTQRLGARPADIAQAAWSAPGPTTPVVLRRGVAEIAQVQAGDTDLRTDTPVHGIDWSASRVVVHTLSASFPADAVIVTAPIGVLQAGAITFHPALPRSTQSALAGLRPGVVDRVAFRFPHQFWGSDGRLGRISATPGRFTSWINLAHPSGAPILVGTVAAAMARSLEPRSDATLTRDALASLRALFS